MAEIKKSNERMINDYMARDYGSFLQSMRELIPYKLPEWKDFESEADFGNVLLQLFAHMGDILSYYQDRIATESFLSTAQSRRSIVHHLKLIGYRLATASPASTTLKISVPDTCDKTITIEKGDAFATKSQKDKPSIRFEYTQEKLLIIDFSKQPKDPQDQKRIYFDGVPVEEGRLIKDEILGGSDGTPNQIFKLAYPELILRSLGKGQDIQKDIFLIVKIGETIDKWNLQETLAFSRDQQKNYVIEIDEDDRATVVFGDGDFGAIPPKGSVIKATYRVGGGSHGNFPKDSITTIVNAPKLAMLGAKVTNEDPATGGADRESIEHAVLHAPHVFRSRKRAVTAEDYKALALDLRGVGRVRAEAAGFNTVKLYVAPEGGGYVSDVLERDLLVHFEDKRPISTIIEVKDVDYVNIYVTATVDIERYYSREDIKEKVIRAGRSLLVFENVDFGQTIYLSKFYEAIEAIDVVRGVNIEEFRREEQTTGEIEPTGKIEMDSNEIPKIPDETDYAGGIKVIPVGGI